MEMHGLTVPIEGATFTCPGEIGLAYCQSAKKERWKDSA